MIQKIVNHLCFHKIVNPYFQNCEVWFVKLWSMFHKIIEFFAEWLRIICMIVRYGLLTFQVWFSKLSNMFLQRNQVYFCKIVKYNDLQNQNCGIVKHVSLNYRIFFAKSNMVLFTFSSMVSAKLSSMVAQIFNCDSQNCQLCFC